MKHNLRIAWTVMACLLVCTGLAVAQDGENGGETEVIGAETEGGPDTAPADGGQAGEAAEGEGGEAGEGEQPQSAPFFGGSMIWIIIGVFVLFYFMMSRSRRKQESKRREMLSSLKKGDKVTSIGGICGTIVDVKEDEITVKVDEANNVKMRFARWSVRGTGETAKAENPQQAEKKQGQ